MSDADLEEALVEAGADDDAAEAVLDENGRPAWTGSQTALATLALLALGGLFSSRRIPTRPVGSD